MAIEVDVAILGGGPGGYTAAIRAAQEGKRVAIVEMDKLGGTCLHRGCIPSKAMLRSAEVYAGLLEAEQFGVKVDGSVALDFRRVLARREETVRQLHNGLQHLMKKHGIQMIYGKGRVIGPSIFSPRSGAIAVEMADGETESVVPANLIIATGSRPRQLPGLETDGERILTSDDVLRLEKLPASILIVGGGVIGVEWASMLNDFGVEVTIAESAPRLLPNEDRDIAEELARQLRRRGVRIATGVTFKAETVRRHHDGISVTADTADGDVEWTAEYILVSVGREPNTAGIGLENTDVRLKDGFIQVNQNFQTSEPHIYAIGDVIGGLQLAHAAAHEGIAAAEHLCGVGLSGTDFRQIPRCIYSRPEIAAIGMTEEQAKAKGYDVAVGRVPFQAIAKAIVAGHAAGFAKVVTDRASGDILGVHLIGPHATELIAEASVAVGLNAAHWEIGRAVHPHPTLSEAIAEAMLAIDGKSLVI